jgi:hypothetical protein
MIDGGWCSATPERATVGQRKHRNCEPQLFASMVVNSRETGTGTLPRHRKKEAVYLRDSVARGLQRMESFRCLIDNFRLINKTPAGSLTNICARKRLLVLYLCL